MTLADDERWELIDGTVEMMTDPTENHGQITMNLAAPRKAALDASGCRTTAGSMRVQASEERNAGNATLPDIVARCGPSRRRTFIADPVLVAEVPSRSTVDRDRGAKLAFYKSLPTIEHIVPVYQAQMRIEHYRRQDGGWRPDVLTHPAARLTLDAAKVTVPLATISFDVGVRRPVATGEPPEDEPPTPVRQGRTSTRRCSIRPL